MNIEKAKVWSNALRSGKYPQCHGVMSDEKGFCCLGVAHEVLIGPVPVENIQAIGYSAIAEELEINHSTVEERISTFINMNDFNKMSFAEIADYIDSVIIK